MNTDNKKIHFQLDILAAPLWKYNIAHFRIQALKMGCIYSDHYQYKNKIFNNLNLIKYTEIYIIYIIIIRKILDS